MVPLVKFASSLKGFAVYSPVLPIRRGFKPG